MTFLPHRNYPATTKCRLCGKDAGDHNAFNSACPSGRKHRVMGYSYSTSAVFSPRIPRLKKQITEALTCLVETINNNHREAQRMLDDKSFTYNRRVDISKALATDLEFARWQLAVAVQGLENPPVEKRKVIL